MTTMKNKPVSFNLDNPGDKKLFEHVKDVKNFSGYAKSLIYADLKRKSEIKVEVGNK
ncbi:hypothetical protein NSA56_01325 [Oceanobacillus caeni]|uniref:hypothetical protein n=1 Tax=Oceanobacillus caeni TaxID=405946 RepID=UPI00214A5330|nr:hypothetical protein [Oceanobacillus caeni]MCR1833036.1 hypothetical protein [Oceanobacillus caeni]